MRMRILRHGNDDGFSFVETLVELLGILVVVCVAAECYLNIVRFGEKSVERIDGFIEEQNAEVYEKIKDTR